MESPDAAGRNSHGACVLQSSHNALCLTADQRSWACTRVLQVLSPSLPRRTAETRPCPLSSPVPIPKGALTSCMQRRHCQGCSLLLTTSEHAKRGWQIVARLACMKKPTFSVGNSQSSNSIAAPLPSASKGNL